MGVPFNVIVDNANNPTMASFSFSPVNNKNLSNSIEPRVATQTIGGGKFQYVIDGGINKNKLVMVSINAGQVNYISFGDIQATNILSQVVDWGMPNKN